MKEPIHGAAIGGILLIADGLSDIDLTDPDLALLLQKMRIHPVMKKLMIGSVRYEVTATLYKDKEKAHEMITDKDALLSDKFLWFQSYHGDYDRVLRTEIIQVNDNYWQYKEPTAYPDESEWFFDIRAIHPCGTVQE